MDIQAALLDSIRRADRSTADRAIRAWVASRGAEGMLAEVLEPVLRIVGDQWFRDESFTLAQAYVSSRIAEDCMELVADQGVLLGATRGPVVLGNIEEDFHGLGRRLVGTFLRTRGWLVVDLGNDVAAKDFVDQALHFGASVIGVSAMSLSTARNIARVREELESRSLASRIKLAVGGAVFCLRPDLAGEVGGDGTAPDAREAALLIERLWIEAKAAPLSA